MLPDNKKTIIIFILSLSLMGLIFIGFIYVILNLPDASRPTSSTPPQSPSRGLRRMEDSYHFAEPNDLEFYETVYKFKKQEVDFENKEIISGVIPHHLLAGDLIAEFFSNFSPQISKDYDTIILIGPNHFSAGNSKMISSAYDWQTPYGILEHDGELLDELLKNNSEVKIEEDIFENEHSIKSEVAFIKKTFPNAKFIPLIIKPETDEKIASDLAESLNNLSYRNCDNQLIPHQTPQPPLSGGRRTFPPDKGGKGGLEGSEINLNLNQCDTKNNLKKIKKILLLASVDFSHYKDSETAQADDKMSISALQNFDFSQVYDLAIDSPASIYVLLKYSELGNAQFQFLNNSNSSILSQKPEIVKTTSYVTGYFVK